MSEVLKLEIPLGDLFRKSKLKRITSIGNSFQTLNNLQIIADRFIIIKCLGSGGFGEVCLINFDKSFIFNLGLFS
jgi:hypothetical protein